jgi:tetratricopeptide (TPR) repeat protein
LNTNNYKEALASLEKIDDKDQSLNKAYQKVAYYRGLELYNNRHYSQAISAFNKSLEHKEYDQQIASLAYYWRGEAFFQLEKFDQAAKSFNEFILAPGAFSSEVYNKAHYNLAYSYFKQENYPEAIKWFRKYINLTDKEKSEYLADTYNRLGDCYFMQRSHWQSIEYYDKAIELGLRDQDYGLYHRAIALGLLNRPQKKIRSLKRLVQEFPDSDYKNNAYYELGRSYMNIDKLAEAKPYFDTILEDYTSGKYVKKALVELGLIHYNQDENDQAIKYYKRVVAEYPGTREAKNALTGLKNIYVERNNVDEYFTYVDGLGDFARVSMSEQDSLTFSSAEKVYMKGNCESALEFLKKYLSKFENGNFSVNAHFYMGDCYNRQDEVEKALKHFDYVLDKPNNAFTEQALAAAMELYKQQGEIEKAIEHFKRMEKIAEVHANLIRARTGLMRMYFGKKQYEKAIETADKVLHTEKVNTREKREAKYIKGKSFFELQKYDKAMENFRLIADEVNSEEGAEAKYRIAQIYFKNGEFKVARTEIFDFVEQNSSEEYWKAKSFLLLAEVYQALDDKFQAKHTLKSIMDNYEPVSEKDDIIATAKKRYNQLIEEEEIEMKGDSTSKEMKIDIGGGTKNRNQETQKNKEQ